MSVLLLHNFLSSHKSSTNTNKDVFSDLNKIQSKCNCQLFQKRLTYNTKGENFPVLSFFLRFCFYLFERERERRNLEGGRGRGRSKLPAENPEIMTRAKGRCLTN